MNEHLTNKSIDMMIKAAWNITYTSFWNTWTLSSQEIRSSKSFIRNFICNAPEAYPAYLEYCQRVLLAREYIIKNPDKYVPIPSIWFCTKNVNGFAGTARWFRNTQDIRRALPLYRNQFKALPEAILEMIEEPTARNFHYWREWFIIRNKQATVNLFLSVVAQCRF